MKSNDPSDTWMKGVLGNKETLNASVATHFSQ